MNRINQNLIMCQVTVVLLGMYWFTVEPTFAQSGGNYDLTWSTIDGGGGTGTGGNYSLSGTIGQTDAGTMAGGDYRLEGGFWSGRSFCFVNVPDLAEFLSKWLLKESEVGHPLDADFNSDGEVNLADYNLFVGSWLTYCPDNWPSW